MSKATIPDPAPVSVELERERERSALAELAAAKADLTAAVGASIESLLRAHAPSATPLTTAEAAERMRRPLPAERDPLAMGPEHVSWHELTNLMEHEPERARAAWLEVKRAARYELQSGTRAARALERSHSRPWERAQFLAILEALNESLKPRGGAEALLVQQMAQALEQQFRWQRLATRRAEEEVWQGEADVRRALERMSPRERERHQEFYGWLPPRQSAAEAIEQAATLADRYGRQFLRLLRSFRDMRRVLGTVVMTGGQLNVAEQQIVTGAHERDGGE